MIRNTKLHSNNYNDALKNLINLFQIMFHRVNSETVICLVFNCFLLAFVTYKFFKINYFRFLEFTIKLCTSFFNIRV